MHELSVALSILDIAAEESRRRGDARVVAIHLRVGALAGIVPEALVGAFSVARGASPFPDCQLSIEAVAVEIYCGHCHCQRSVESVQFLCCPECGAPPSRIVRGREMEVFALEIEEPADAPLLPRIEA